jgi:hypothetical protein
VKYRADIDGLRAIAVGAVVAFHAGVPGSSGGYVGVDVFFVISGFLITTILVSELAAEGRLSFARFYERRIRRIFPALFAMIAVTAPVAAVVLLPSDLARFGASVAATTAFASNVLFWSEAGYFQTDSELKPLLHTWSLAVEEQFYFALPVLLWALHRAGLRSRPAIAWAAAASFALSVLFVWRRRELGFFLPFGRAWELLLGSWLAAGPPLPLSDRARGALSWAGLAALALPIVAYDAQTPFPGPARAPPLPRRRGVARGGAGRGAHGGGARARGAADGRGGPGLVFVVPVALAGVRAPPLPRRVRAGRRRRRRRHGGRWRPHLGLVPVRGAPDPPLEALAPRRVRGRRGGHGVAGGAGGAGVGRGWVAGARPPPRSSRTRPAPTTGSGRGPVSPGPRPRWPAASCAARGRAGRWCCRGATRTRTRGPPR